MTKTTIDIDTVRDAMAAIDLMFMEMNANYIADATQVLAAVQHEIWSHWMRYMFTQGVMDSDNEVWLMPAEKVTRWKRQMNTPYAELTEQERNSDIDQALKVINALSEWYERLQP